MNDIYISDMHGNEVNAKLIFSFICPETQKKYIAIDYKKQIFEKNSKYNNLDILEVVKEARNKVLVTNINENEWDIVRDSLQNRIFATLEDL